MNTTTIIFHCIPPSTAANAIKGLSSLSVRPVSIHAFSNARRGTRRALSTQAMPISGLSPTFPTAPTAKEAFPRESTGQIRKTPAAWHHPIYTQEQLDGVTIHHREARTLSDRTAYFAVRVLRWGMDFATGYKHDKAVALAKTDSALAEAKYGMTEQKYLVRNIFLESVAGVPGMVAGMLRHLRSMRLMRRDNGWMETLLEESYNERMHLLIFLKLDNPGWLMRLMVLAAQGVFFNGFFFAYLISPRTCHRFVGYLEEEACITYSREIEDMDRGRLPKWSQLQAPQIAVDYYSMKDGAKTMRDLLLNIRADEAGHRAVNHTLANLDQKNDPNPFVSLYREDAKVKPPQKDDFHLKPAGWERDECI